MSNLYIAFAPLQGYTDAVYRRAHHECVGGVDEYYTPFVRVEHGEVRKKDLRDIDPERNAGVPTVPQVIAKDAGEFARLCDAVQGLGWNRIDLNMGCPFPMQVKAGRGCGLLQYPDRVGEMAREMQQRPEIRFSVKMRLGQESAEEGMRLLPIINAMPLVHVTLHPRLGRQQYKGTVDMGGFLRFQEECRHPLVYNGDLTSCIHTPPPCGSPSPNLGEELGVKGLPSNLGEELGVKGLPSNLGEELNGYEGLKGVMIGRGLLARPWMIHTPPPCGSPSPNLGEELVRQMHERVYRHATEHLCGDSQILSRLHAFWEYVDIPHKQKKAIMKAATLPRYREAVASAISCRPYGTQ